MANIFTLENLHEFSEKINLDELYESKKKHDLMKLDIFHKLLNRIHVKIKTTAKRKMNEPFCWFVVPEFILGVPKYDQGLCIAFLMDKLKENGFIVEYIHPNLLFIGWNHFIPTYVRNEIKKKTGIAVDEFGRPIEKDKEGGGDKTKKNSGNDYNYNQIQGNGNGQINNNSYQKLNEHWFEEEDEISLNQPKKKTYTPIDSYKPKGNLVYDASFFDSLSNKFHH